MTVLTEADRRNGAQPLLSGLSFVPRQRAAAKPKSHRFARFGDWARGHADQIRTVTLSVIGLGAPTTAAFEWHGWAGLLALGLSALLLDVAFERAKKGRGNVTAR